jgi:tetratricopeptide (TPR) repeat protein
VATRDELILGIRARLRDRATALSPEAAELARALMATVPDPTADPAAVQVVADLYQVRALLTGDGQDAAIAAALTRLSTPGWLLERHQQAIDLLTAAGHDPTALEETVPAARAAVDATPAAMPRLRAAALANLGTALRLRYQRTGSLADLAEAVGALRTALVESAGVHVDRAGIESALGVVLRTRYERSGTLDDLQESVRLGRAAADATPPGDFNRGGRLHNLGIALRLRYECTQDQTDLDDAIRVSREAVSVTPLDHPGYAQFRTGLVNALMQRKENPSELVELDEQALAVTPPGDELRPGILVSLASALVERDSGGDRDRAVALLREARAAMPDGHAMMAIVDYELGLALWHWGTGRPEDLTEAAASAEAAATRSAAPPRTRLLAAIVWGRSAMQAGDPGRATAGYRAAIGLLPAITAINLTRQDAEDALTRFPGLAGDAAAAALASGDPEAAVTLLEQGRGVLLGQALQGRDELTELRERAPELAARLIELRAALGADRSPAGYATAADIGHDLATEWDQKLAEVRELPGLAGFLRPPPVARLVEQARPGPVVMVNVSRFRCDALVLTSDGPRVVPLPGLTLETVVDRAVAFGLALEGPDENVLSESLGWLWDVVAGPVLDALGPASRVWWIPTGALAFLPLHAAGHHRAGGGRTVLDRVTSSYAATVSALAHVRRGGSRGTGPFLVVAVPEAPGASPLPGAAVEATALAGMLPAARVLLGPEATRDAVLAGMRDGGWLHFCGHGSADPYNPSRSQLIVHDHATHPLTVAEVSRLNLRTADLAYLSACTTARTGTGLADEALHLASGMQLAGYRHVIGTLWEIDDAAALHIATGVYAGLGAPRPDADRAAVALHAVVRELRDRFPGRPSLWAAHVHVGA